MKLSTTILRRLTLVLVITFIASISTPLTAQTYDDTFAPKREFRGAWLHVIGQTQYQNMSTDECQRYICSQLDLLLDAGCNAVIFQIRPCADALYASEYEPWSAWLTGKRGRKPHPMWDPLQFVIEQAHDRGMELHAWLNPYRVTSSAKEVLPQDHLVNREPHRFFKYNGQTFFDPAYEENRQYICQIVSDIVQRYDIDAIHMDDYFYPYPNSKSPFNADKASYAKFGGDMDLADWRRDNVNRLIEMLHQTIKKTKSWVRFGISPFGIWRNISSDPRGSQSNGLENYDDLYADVLLWDEKGWVDYFVPQLYWQLDLKAAPSRSLARWWNDHILNAHLYIGQEVKRTMDTADPGNNDDDELDTKIRLSRQLERVKGNVWWHGYWVTGNYKGVADSLALKHQSTLALPPAHGDQSIRPRAVSNLRRIKVDSQLRLTWDAAECDEQNPKETDIVRYVVYQFFEGETIDITDPQTIVAITPHRQVVISENEPGTTYIVTALDRLNRESAPVTYTLR